MRVGIDVGGTNTDAVLMEGRQVLGWAKSPTTRDVSSGITNVLTDLLSKTHVDPGRITAVMLGTTHFTNAVVERKSLARTAIVRIGLPATAALPPFVDWPEDLQKAIDGVGYLVHGGYEFDGRPIAPLDDAELREVAHKIRDTGVNCVAISSVFSPVNPDHEQHVAQVISTEIPGARISLSHEIGRIGLLERENAAIMNACLSDLALRIVNSFRSALSTLGLTAPFFISQNDGTLMSADYVEKYPVLTFASGPTNSMRGAALLSGRKDAVVVDIGGTTSDVGVLAQGFPREASVAVRIGGVRTNFRMPDVLSFGLGGGSHVKNDPLQVGPQSVGYEITSRALVFGGSDLTATDIAVASGLAEVGDRGRVAHLDRTMVTSALRRMQEMVEVSIDRMKTTAGDVPVILVGGGTILMGGTLQGASELLRPEHAPVANAIGAAIAQVGGEVDRVFSLDTLGRDKALQQAKDEAQQRVLNEGAVAGTVEIVEIEEIPLSYLPGNATRIRVKAIGELAVEQPMWQISVSDVEAIAIGAGILGAGGGGNPYLGQMHITTLLQQGRSANVIGLDDVADDAYVAVVGVMGAPTVGVEKLPRGDEAPGAIEALEKFTGKTIDALACAEIGGANSIVPLIGSALTGKPVLDGDAMGRAFPETQMSTHFINGVNCTPAAMVDEKGNCIIFSHVINPRELERFARHLCVTMGCISMLALPMMTGYQARTTSVPRTISLAKRLGDAVLNARGSKQPIISAILECTGGSALFAGKLVDVQRRTTEGFARGQARIDGFDAFDSEQLRIEFQNENLVAWRKRANGDPVVVATVPDLICVVDSESGEPVTTEQLRYGLRVTVLGIPCSDKLRTRQALPVVNPAAFGYPDIQYSPIPKTLGQGIE